jgi:hypothetical protein
MPARISTYDSASTGQNRGYWSAKYCRTLDLRNLNHNFSVCFYLIDAQDPFGGEHCRFLNFSVVLTSLYLSTHQGSGKMPQQPHGAYLFLEVLHC